MATIWIPPLLRDLTAGREQVRVPGGTVGELVDALEKRFPGLRARLCEGDDLSPLLAVVVDGKRSRLGLLQPVGEESEIHLVPAVAGG